MTHRHGSQSQKHVHWIKGSLTCAVLIPALLTPNLSLAVAACATPYVGAPSCSQKADPGSASTPTELGVHIGNPIEAIGGNKYQQETDYQAVGSALTWTRHYNSALVHRDIGLGPGWTHSWQLDAFVYLDGRLGVRQSDGRTVVFTHVPGTAEPAVFKAQYSSDGIAIRSPELEWILGDGRRVSFKGPRPVTFHDREGRSIDLRYDAGRLADIQDSFGRTLSINYVTTDEPLPAFGGDERPKPIGAIESVQLPTGDSVHYAFGPNRLLIEAERTDGETVSYGYGDPRWPANLTHRHSTDSKRASKWQYDDQGRANYWQSAPGGLSLIVSRSKDVPIEDTTATVRYSDGRVRTVQNKEVVSSGDPVFSQLSESTERNTSQWARFEQSIVATATPISGTHDLLATATIDHDAFPVRLAFDSTGTLINADFGEQSLGDIATRFTTGELPACIPGAVFSQDSLIRRLGELATGAPACSSDAVLLHSTLDSVVERLQTPRHSLRKIGLPIPSPQNTRCGFPGAGGAEREVDCDAWAQHYELAGYADCAYDGSVCPHEAHRIDPASIGMSESDFHDTGFDAELFYDPAKDTYILSFRGTDTEGDDWTANFAQGAGNQSRQYDLAEQLAKSLLYALPQEQIRITGHSLGGGLASHAGLILGAQTTVFNPAALHPNTAEAAGTSEEYANAEDTIEVVRVDGDPVSGINNISQSLGLGAGLAPGNHTVLESPPDAWLQARPGRAFWRPDDAYERHSMDAVFESLRIDLDEHCGVTV